MKREEKFLISHAPYAVQLDSFTVEEKWATFSGGRVAETPYYTITIPAIWFRRKDGILSAHIGTLWGSERERPASAEAWLTDSWDGRYGGNCQARWDGISLWAPDVTWNGMVNYQGVLAWVLENFPQVPDGFDGWWTYKR